MDDIDLLLGNNKRWSQAMQQQDPAFFSRLAGQQTPRYLWIGCSDSRVPANEIVGLAPGEVFVHRNIANLIVHTDLNCLSVIQYAIDVLKVQHVMVVGHYGCGGVQAALRELRVGLADYWLRYLEDIRHIHGRRLALEPDETSQANRLAEINVIEQVCNFSRLEVVRSAWQRGQPVSVHGLIYGLHDGVLRNLGASMHGPLDLVAWRKAALTTLWSPHRLAG
ncbi:carbonate dehydratase [Aquabacterium soli]|jgi:carbonic anhydrase|uniref:Carbonic anhydrase n=1 Tax=Aquabacterium soli TaxID=2493092 RepID=A0A3R8RZM2_9BURK|nr:carbonate dehydratase [Aquabacterium soli]RRS02689.1 carbonate dehydratase [Aquabacterium soli]